MSDGDHHQQRPQVLQYEPSALPEDAANELRPALHRIGYVMASAFALGGLLITGILLTMGIYFRFFGLSYDTRHNAIGESALVLVMGISILLPVIIAIGAIWWLFVRSLRWAIRDEGLVVARRGKIIRVVPWANIVTVSVRPIGTHLELDKRLRGARLGVHLSPLEACDGETVRQAWLSRRYQA